MTKQNSSDTCWVHDDTAHSDDIHRIHTGRPYPLVLCGKHAGNIKAASQKIPDWIDLDPNDWPHTPPLEAMIAISDTACLWKIETGHWINAFDAAVEEIHDLRQRLSDLQGDDIEYIEDFPQD